MWPWEHLAFGYVLYALGRRRLDGRPPSNGVVIALAVGTQFPDLVDKPLAWIFGVLPSGTSMAHSLLFAVPVTIATIVATKPRERRPIAVAFSVGYLSHIVGDGLYFLVTNGDLSVGYALWPLVSRSGGNESIQVIVPRLWSSFLQFLGSPQGRLYLALEVAFLAFAMGLWLRDGRPGFPRLEAFRS